MPKFLKNGKQAQYEVPASPLTVVMEDEIIHTPEFPICSDPECICHREEQYRLQAEYKPAKSRPKSRALVGRYTAETPTSEYDGPPSYNQPFNLLR